jgi:hypothetical protein
MLENKGHRSYFSNFNVNRLRETWTRIFRAFFSHSESFPRGLSGVGERELSRGLDEEVPTNIQSLDIEMTEERPKTRDEIFSESHFEWVKTERAGDICNFKEFEIEDGVEYVGFTDGSRIKMEFVGDIVLMHNNPHEIIGNIGVDIIGELPTVAANPMENIIEIRTVAQTQPTAVSTDPVISILEKSKKRHEKLNLIVTVKIPSVELYNVIKENFENTDDVLLENVMDQIHGSMLKDAVKKELQTLYSKKKKN